MTHPAKLVVTSGLFSMPMDDVLQRTITANRISAESGQPDGNPYEDRNALLVEREKEKVRYDKNGYRLPVAARILLNDAAERSRHSVLLASNLCKSSPGIAPGKLSRPPYCGPQ